MAKINKAGAVVGDTADFRRVMREANIPDGTTIWNDQRMDKNRRLKAYGAGHRLTANQVGQFYAAAKRIFGYRLQSIDFGFSIKIYLTDQGVV